MSHSEAQAKVCDFADYIIRVRNYKRYYPSQREGQVYMNVLFAMRGDLYNRITGTTYDPFYDDDKVPMFLTFLGGLW
jgi:hypothetical protein